MTDAAFIWSTNIGEVASQIESGLARIRSSVDRGVSKAGGPGSVLGDRGDFLGAGVERRAKAISAELNRGLTQAARNYERGMREAAKAGRPFQGIVPQGGTTPTTSWRAISAPLVAQAQKGYQQLGAELGTALQGPLAGMRGDFTKYTQALAASTLEGARRLSDVIAKGGTYTDPTTGKARRFQGGLVQLRDELGVTGVKAQQFTLGPKEVERALVNAARVAPPADTGKDAILASRLAIAGKDGATAARASVREMEVREASIKGALAEAQRVVREIRANTDARGRPIDPRGAREDRGLLIDRAGRRFVRDDGPEGSGGVLPLRYTQGPLGELERAREQWETNAQAESRHLQERRAAQQQMEREGKNINTLRRRAAADEFRNAEIQGRAIRTGTMRAPGRFGAVLRDEQGRQLAQPRYLQFRGDQAEPVRTPAGLRDAQNAVTAAVATRAKTEAEASAENVRRTQVERGLRTTQEQALRAARGGAGGGGRPPMPVAMGGFGDQFGAAISGQTGRGFRLQDLMGSALQYSRYVISAAVVGGSIAALSKARSAVVNYRDSLTDLEIAIGNNERASERFVSNLSDVARLAGANTGDAIDAAVRGIRAFGDLDDAPSLERTGTEFADTAAMLAVIAEKDLRDATGDLIAVGSAFDLTEGQFTRVIDAVAVAKRQLGGDAKQVAQGLSSIGTAAAEAGFTLEETANVVSLVQARTDQTGRAVAQRLSRIFSIIGGSSGRSAIETLNRQLSEDMRIDTTGSVRDQLLGVSQIYDQLSDQQRGFVRNALGGVANQREIIPLLSEPEALARALDEQFGAAGAGFDEFNRKANDLVGIIRKIRGSIEGIFTGLFRAGAFDVIAFAVKYGVEPMLNGIRLMVNAVNDLRDGFRSLNVVTDFLGEWGVRAAIFIAQLRAARAAISYLQGAGLLRSGAAAAVQPTQLGPGGMYPVLRGGPQVPMAGVRPSPVTGPPLVGIARVNDDLRALGRGVQNLGQRAANFVRANPLLSIAVGITVLNQAIRSLRQSVDQITATRDVLSREMAASTAADLRSYAQEVAAAGEQARQARSGFFGGLFDMARVGATPDPGAREIPDGENEANRFVQFIRRQLDSGILAELERRADARSSLLIDQANILESRQATLSRSTRPSDVFDLRTPEGAAEGMQLLAEQGRDATTQFNALTKALRDAGEVADGLGMAFGELARLRIGQEISADIARRVGGLADEGARGTERSFLEFVGLTGSGGGFDGFAEYWGRGGFFNLSMLADNDAARREARARADTLSEVLDAESLAALNEYSIALLDRTGGVLDDANIEQVEAALFEWFSTRIDNFESVSEDIDEAVAGSIEDIIEQFRGLVDSGMIDQAIIRERIQGARAMGTREGTRARAGGGGSGAIVEAREYLNALREVERWAREDRGLGDADLEILRDEIEQAELAYVQVQAQRARRLAGLAAGARNPADQLGQLREEIRGILQAIDLNEGNEDALEELQGELASAQWRQAELIRNRANAALRAGTDNRDAVAQAYAEATIAWRELADLEAGGAEGTEAYFNAQVQARDAMNAHSMALLNAANAEAVMQIDTRDQKRLAQQEAANIFAQMMVLESSGLSDSVAMNDLRRQFAATVVNGARQELAMAEATRQFVASMYQQLWQMVQAMMSSINYVGDSWGRAIARDTAHASAGVRGIIGRIRNFASLGEAVNVGLSRLPTTLTDPDAFSTSSASAAADVLRRTLFDPRDDVARARAALTDARRELARQARGSAEYHNQLQAVREAQVALAEAIRGQSAAARGSRVDPRSAVQRARVAVLDARAQVRGALANTTGWFQAVASLNQAQVDYADALEQARMRRRLMLRDSSDPVVVAREELRMQRRQLERARSRGAPQDVLDELGLGVRGAEENLQQTQLNQWLTDLDNARTLGQISNQAYIRFIEQEIARMQTYENMTRAQMDQLTRLQLALKAAKDQVDAQFNIGDIRMPTPYEVRRAIAGGGGAFDPGRAMQVVNNTSSTDVTNFISIDGANMAEVEAILRKLMSSGATATYTAGSRRI